MNDANGPPMLLITGTTGSGTSILAESLRTLVRETEYFLTAKFDHLMLPIPYMALVAAFTEFTKIVWNKGKDEVEKMREKILFTLGEETFHLVSMIPALQSILGPVENHQSPSVVCKGTASRFLHIFRSFVSAVCSASTSPVVLVIENLQWADKCSLDLISTWRGDPVSLKKLILVGTCDPTRVAVDSHLSTVLRNIEDSTGQSIVEFQCTNLSEPQTLLVANELATGSVAQALGKVLYAATKGSILAMDMLGRRLEDERIVSSEVDNGKWSFDLKVLTEGVEKQFIDDLCDLSRDELHVVMQFCSLGPCLEREVMRCLWKKSDVRRLVVDCRCRFALKNTETRSLIYDLHSNHERQALHLEIGMRLFSGLDEDQLDSHLFVALSQLYLSRPLQLEDTLQAKIASSCLSAAKKAAKLSTFRIACQYLEFGIECLGSKCWEKQYLLALALHNALAEMHSCLSNYHRMNEIIELVLRNADCHRDKLQAYSGRVYAEGIAGHHQEAFHVGLTALCSANECIPSRANKFQLQKYIFSVSKSLAKKSNQQVLRIQSTKDETKLACMRILQLMMTFAAQAGQNADLFSLVVVKLMTLTLQDGMSVFAALAFAEFGLIYSNMHTHGECGYRCGEIALRLLEKHGSVEYLPRVYLIFYHHLSPLKNHVRDSVEPLRLACRIAAQSGDYETMGHCVAACLYAMREASMPLDIVVRHFEEYKSQIVTNGQKQAFWFVLPVMEAVYRYIGLSPDPISGKGVLLDYDEALQVATEKGYSQIRSIILVIRAKVAYYFNEYETALRFLATENDIKNLKTSYVCVQNAFSRGLILIAGARMGYGKVGQCRLIRRTIKRLHHHAQRCPENFLDKAYLLEAEAASLSGRNFLAYSKYKSAISAATSSNLTFYQGLANELAARHLVRTKKFAEALPHFTNACAFYAKWGGLAKLSRLQAEIESIYKDVKVADANPS